MKEINLTSGRVAIVDDDDFEELSKFKWHYTKKYAGRSVKCGSKWKAIKMHRVISKCPDHLQTDHRNRNTLDNRKSNLRICKPSQNGQNQKLRVNSSTGFKGVKKYYNKFVAKTTFRGVQIYIGAFKTPQLAAMAYDNFAVTNYGEFACTNKSLGLL